jgi:hypothetical protein
VGLSLSHSLCSREKRIKQKRQITSKMKESIDKLCVSTTESFDSKDSTNTMHSDHQTSTKAWKFGKHCLSLEYFGLLVEI